MNDLLSLPRYQDPNRDLEKGMGEGDEGSLDKFFSRIEDVKEDMKFVEQIRKKLQDSNETSKTIHNANAMKDLRAKMDADILQVLKRVKNIKKKLEDLEKANETHRKLPGCGPGSSIDRTRVSVVRGLGKKLKDLMGEFQDLRSKMADEYKETVARRYFTITGEKADEEVVDNLIESGESETFLQKAIQEQGRGQIMDAISEIQERHDAVKDIEKNLLELHQLFLDMAALVEAQGHQLDNIENHVAQASSFVKRGTVQLQEARETQKSTRKWKCIVILILLLFLLAILLPVFLKNQQQQHHLPPPPPPPHQPPPHHQ